MNSEYHAGVAFKKENDILQLPIMTSRSNLSFAAQRLNLRAPTHLLKV
jgi:hypothetical protein